MHTSAVQSTQESFANPLFLPALSLNNNSDLIPDVILDPNQILLKKDIHFPLEYKVTGHADLSWEAIAKKFYGDVNQIERLKYFNPTLAFRPIETGDILHLPAPDALFNDLPAQIRAGIFNKTPANQIFTENGRIRVTAEEFDLFTRVLATESGPNWDYQGVRMIAETITNRIRNKKINLYDVIMQADQFSVIDSGAYLLAQPTELHRQVAIDALIKNKLFTPDVEFFCTEEAYQQVTWFQELRIVTRYGGVIFMSNQYDPNRRPKTTTAVQPATSETTQVFTDQQAVTNPQGTELQPTHTLPTQSSNPDTVDPGNHFNGLFTGSGEHGPAPRQP